MLAEHDHDAFPLPLLLISDSIGILDEVNGSLMDEWNASYQILCGRLNGAYVEKSAALNGRDRRRFRSCDASRSAEKTFAH